MSLSCRYMPVSLYKVLRWLGMNCRISSFDFNCQAKKTCPLLMKYEHAWPLGAYMHRYLYDLNMRRNNERVFGTSVAVRGGASDGDEDEPSDEGILDVRLLTPSSTSSDVYKFRRMLGPRLVQ